MLTQKLDGNNLQVLGVNNLLYTNDRACEACSVAGGLEPRTARPNCNEAMSAEKEATKGWPRDEGLPRCIAI